MNEYRTLEECKYYGSDLNKFVGENCTKKMIVNNVDLVIYKYGKNILRIIESKHDKEKSNKSQMMILNLLSKAKIGNHQVEVFIISGDPPYESVDIFCINNEISALLVPKEILIQFLNFEISFEKLVGVAEKEQV